MDPTRASSRLDSRVFSGGLSSPLVPPGRLNFWLQAAASPSACGGCVLLPTVLIAYNAPDFLFCLFAVFLVIFCATFSQCSKHT